MSKRKKEARGKRLVKLLFVLCWIEDERPERRKLLLRKRREGKSGGFEREREEGAVLGETF